jgi:glycosyltransferase involved in cell wall biosynthesis
VSEPVVSIIIPAHDEEALLGATLAALRTAIETLDVPVEIVVVDDASTDRTAEIARAAGAQVVGVTLRHIAAARNAGARAARGELLIFVDADTIVPAAVLRGALAAMYGGAAGGGAPAVADADSPPWVGTAMRAVVGFMRIVKWAAGCFVFARRDAFERAGGFDERYFASEEIHFSRALKKHGRFVVLEDAVITSGRKAQLYSPWRSVGVVLSLLRPGGLRRRNEFWYGPRGR